MVVWHCAAAQMTSHTSSKSNIYSIETNNWFLKICHFVSFCVQNIIILGVSRSPKFLPMSLKDSQAHLWLTHRMVVCQTIWSCLYISVLKFIINLPDVLIGNL